MKHNYIITIIYLALILNSCNSKKLNYIDADQRIIFLHHSTGGSVWKGEVKGLSKIAFRLGPSEVPRLMKEYNRVNEKKYAIREKWYPEQPYPNDNYPFDYFNIWVENAGMKPYMGNETLEMLTRDYDLVIFKHCFPGSYIEAADSNPDIHSSKKTLANYELQYSKLREKLLGFPETKFLLWTIPAIVENNILEDQARRSKEFRNWVIKVWDRPGDNIYIFDFRLLETDGGLYMNEAYAKIKDDSHPDQDFSKFAAEKFVERIIEVLE